MPGTIFTVNTSTHYDPNKLLLQDFNSYRVEMNRAYKYPLSLQTFYEMMIW